MTPPLLLMDAKALRKRLDGVYSTMRTAAKPKLFATGKRRGHVRLPGLVALPFDRDQFWDHALQQLGTGLTPCPYCVAIGRAPNFISLADCVFDHKIPRARAGHPDCTLEQVWALINLVAVCADCNNLKGKLSYPFFIGLMANVEKWPDKRDLKALYACLRTHGRTLQGFRGKPKPTEPHAVPVTPGSLTLTALHEDF